MGTNLPLLDLFLRLLAAVVFGMVIGWDREARRKPAGLRTHMLVSLGAASFTVIALEWYRVADGNISQGIDPGRAIQGIVTGIGFLGAGSIIRAQGTVHGVTTAAGIWVIGAIGAAAGAGQYILGAMITGLSFAILRLLPLSREVSEED
jgi:putative Mg2+ transporter-C (MgtC) family protein